MAFLLVNSFLASGEFFSRLLITFANSLDIDQDQQNVDPDPDPNIEFLKKIKKSYFLYQPTTTEACKITQLALS